MNNFDKFKLWLDRSLELFKNDPPDTDIQQGFLMALKQVKEEVERIEQN